MTIVTTLERAIKGAGLVNTVGTVVHLGGVRYRVLSSDGRQWYIVNLAEPTCTCPDNRYRGVLCKHIHAARQTAYPARLRASVDVQGNVTNWRYADDGDDTRHQAETVKRLTDELFPL